MGTARTIITNVSTGALTLPPPWNVVVPAGKSVVVADSVSLVTSILGSTLSTCWRVSTDVATDVPTVVDSGILVAVLDLTNAQVKALHGTPKAIVAAPGTGNVLVPISAEVFLKYGGTNAFTSAAASVLAVKRTGGADLLVGGTQAFLQGTASGVQALTPATAPADSKTLSDNIALQVWNNNASEIAGNAGLDNTLRVVLRYSIDSAPAGW